MSQYGDGMTWRTSRAARRFPRLAHEHSEQRTALKQLRLVAGHPSCPPAGHAFIGLVGTLGAFFGRELPRHAAREEAELYPSLAAALTPEEHDGLLQEHAALQLLAREFGALATELVARADESTWARMRDAAQRLATTLHDHLAHEEAVVDRSTCHAS